MANHTSAQKRVRSTVTRRQQNQYQHKTTRTFVKKMLQTSDKTNAEQLYPQVCSLLDKLAKRHVIHRNKAARKKAQLARHLKQL